MIELLREIGMIIINYGTGIGITIGIITTSIIAYVIIKRILDLR